jgi:CHASE2 domain-containing sensor protein
MNSGTSRVDDEREYNSMGTAGGVIGVIAFVVGWIPIFGIVLGIVLGIIGLVFSSVGLAVAGRVHIGRKRATIGLILSIVIIVLKLIPGISIL